ncbi:MAG: glycosyltransferase family 4 protein [Chloroflexi bacterium]|nr:glycosyltransferase family 4 protein [Chloroflexota bacterium]
MKHRVLFCSTALTFGGEQKQLAQVLGHLDRQRFEVILCCIRRFKHVDEAIRQSGVPLVCLGIRGPYDLRSIWRLRRVIRQYDIDLVHMGIFGSEFPALLAAIWTKKPTVAILQSMFDLPTRLQADNDARLLSRCKWRTLYAAHAVLSRVAKIRFVALSEAVKRSAMDELHLPSSRITVLPLGLRPEEFDGPTPHDAVSEIRSELRLDGAHPVLLNVGRLSPVKGQADLLRAMALLQGRLPGARLLIAGDGPDLPELEGLRDALGLQTKALLLGRRDDIQALLHTSDLFVFSSYYEGLPGAVIEAMAAGKCVVAFDIPALREIIKNGWNGVLVKGRDVALLAGAVVRLAEHPGLARQMGDRARQMVREKFDIRLNVASLEAVYDAMLAGSW